jgi:prepilin-type N-terminal cleavage/methylation domain-containing protein
MRAGFTLLEVLLVLAIVGIMGTMLFTSLTQINLGSRVADSMIDDSERALLLHQQLEKDFMGVMIPVGAVFEEEEKDKSKPSEQKAPAQSKATTQEKKEKAKVVTKVFFANMKDTNLDTLTFITNNPLQVFWSEKVGKLKPLIGRVVYRLVPEKNVKNLFTLKRQESSELQFDAYKIGGTKEIREFAVVEGIQSLSIEYSYVLEPKEKEEKKKEEKSKREVKTEKEWNSDDKEQKKKRDGKEFPDWITVKFVLWDEAREKTQEYEFKIEHIALGLPPSNKVEEPETPQTQNKEEGPGSNLEILAKNIDGLLKKGRAELQNHKAAFNMPPKGNK